MRRGLLLFAAFAALVVLTLVSLPYWLPWVARPVAERYGATFGSYERIGYSRFLLREVRVQRPQVSVFVEQVEADTPVLWAWRHFRRVPSEITATRWSVDVPRRRAPTAAAPIRRAGWRRLQGTLQRVAGGLDRWLRHAAVGPGVVRWARGEVSVDRATWHSGLSVQGLRYRSLLADTASLRFRADGEMELTVQNAAAEAELSLATHAAEVSGQLRWAGQTASIAAEFPPDGWQPARAVVDAAKVQLPAEHARLQGYGDVTGAARLAWTGETLELTVDLAAAPLAGRDLPALALKLAADADRRDRVRVTELEARIPGGEARLSAPVLLDRQGQLHGEPAELRYRFDLGSQPWVDARGVLTGRAILHPRGRSTPDVAFSVQGSNLRLRDVSLREVRARGDLQWPWLRVQQLNVLGPAGEKLVGRVEVDLVTRAVAHASVSGALSGQTVTRWLPPALAFDLAQVEGQAKGPLARLEHDGAVTLRNVRWSRTRLDQLHGTWRGVGAAVTAAELTATAADALIRAEGGLDGSSALRLKQFQWTNGGQPVLALKEPATITFRPAFAIEGLHLVGPEAAVDARLAWGAAGRIDVAVRGLRSEVLRPFFWPDPGEAEPGGSPGSAGTPFPGGTAWKIGSWALTGSWAEGPMTFSSAGELTAQLPDQRVATIRASMRGDTQGVWLEALHGLESGNPVVNASGRLPVVITPWVGAAEGRTGLSRWFELSPKGPLAFEAVTVPNAAFWRQIGAITGVELEAPALTARVEGSWQEPRGRVDFQLGRAAMDPKRFPRPLPTVENVALALVGTGAGLELNRLAFTVEGQAVRASGRLALGGTEWARLWREPGRILRERGEFSLQVPEAQVAMFSRFLPAALAPAGKLEADLRFAAGQFAGAVRLREAASRPLGPLGVLQQVNADVAFRGRRILLERVAATSGGQPVTLTGEVELPVARWMSGVAAQPRYNIVLRGQNVPFVRQAGLLIRGDLDLGLRSNAEGAAAISGRVELRDSLFLTDIRSYLPRGAAASPARRPPYFSVDTPPLDRWALDVTVTGSRFLRVRMPVFSGIASTRIHLGGTLGEPRAIGDATIDEGAVLMPFTTFEVQQGAIRLTEESPYEPTVFLRGTGRHYGYDLTMEISGKASTPNITFSSSPALDPDQVLVMVTTGAAPSNEVTTSLTRRAVQIGAFFGQSLLGSLTGAGGEPGRLSVESGERISRQGRETYSIEYKLNGRWSVTGEYDEFDEYNAGFKWRVAPRKGRK